MDTTTLSPANKTPGIVDALYDYALQEVGHRVTRSVSENDPHALQLKNDFYRNIFQRYRKARNPVDKSALQYVRFQISRMNAKLNPTPMNRIALMVSAIRYFLELFVLRGVATGKELKQFEKQHERTTNLEVLQGHMRKAGFSMNMEGPLQKMMQHDLDSFHLRYYEPRYPHADFVLYFAKKPGTEQYSFEKFDVSSLPDPRLPNQSAMLRQQFGIKDKISFTAAEAAILIQNRPLTKMVEGIERWIVPDHPEPKMLQRSFDLSKELGKMQIKEVSTVQGEKQLTAILKKGGQKEVTMLLPDGPAKFTVSMSRFGDSLNFHDQLGKLVDIDRMIHPETGSLKAKAQKIALEAKQAPVIHMGHNHRI